MFKVKTTKETVALSKEQLLQVLIEKVTSTPKKDHEVLADTIANLLETNGVLKSSSILQIIVLAFSAGYYYRVFLSKNDVTMELSDATDSSNESIK